MTTPSANSKDDMPINQKVEDARGGDSSVVRWKQFVEGVVDNEGCVGQTALFAWEEQDAHYIPQIQQLKQEVEYLTNERDRLFKWNNEASAKIEEQDKLINTLCVKLEAAEKVADIILAYRETANLPEIDKLRSQCIKAVETYRALKLKDTVPTTEANSIKPNV